MTTAPTPTSRTAERDTTTAAGGAGAAPRPSTLDRRARRRPPRLVALAGAAALVLAIVGLVVVVAPDDPPTPAEAVAAAAATTGDLTTLRVDGTYEFIGGNTTRLTADVDGRDADQTTVLQFEDGRRESSRLVVLGDREWEVIDGKVVERPVKSEQKNVPFPQASRAVVAAALEGSEVTDLGEDPVRGEAARHYRVGLTPTSVHALEALSPSELAAFELEYPGEVAGLDVWVADGLIRRVRVESDYDRDGRMETGESVSTVEFFDFGADLEIRPPS